MKRIVSEQIMNHISQSSILNQSQHGFVSGRSCLTSLLSTLEDCSCSLDEKVPTDIVYLDFTLPYLNPRRHRGGLMQPPPMSFSAIAQKRVC